VIAHLRSLVRRQDDGWLLGYHFAVTAAVSFTVATFVILLSSTPIVS
jgi:hypothetical protein